MTAPAPENRYTEMQRSSYEAAARDWSPENRDPVVGSFDAHNNWADYDSYLFRDIWGTLGQKVVLDFGCGPGRNLVKYGGTFKRVDGVDIAQQNLDNAKRWVLHNGGVPGNLYKNNGVDLAGVPSYSYEVVMSTICFQHICVYDIRKNYLREMFRVLKPGGTLTMQMGYGGKEGTGVQTALYLENKYEALTTNSGCDTVVMSSEEIKSDLVEVGFQDFKSYIRPVGPGDNHKNWIFFSARKPLSCCLLIQGKVDRACFERYMGAYRDPAHRRFSEIVLSTYPGDLETVKDLVNDGVEVVLNDADLPPMAYNYQNLYYQASTTQKGLERCRSSYCLKVRGDEFYTNLDTIDFNPDKLLVNDYFLSTYLPNHISDHMLGARKDILLAVMSRVRSGCLSGRYSEDESPRPAAEQRIFAEYLNEMGVSPTGAWLEVANNLLEVAYLPELEPLRIAQNSLGATYDIAAQCYTNPHMDQSQKSGIRFFQEPKRIGVPL